MEIPHNFLCLAGVTLRMTGDVPTPQSCSSGSSIIHPKTVVSSENCLQVRQPVIQTPEQCPPVLHAASPPGDNEMVLKASPGEKKLCETGRSQIPPLHMRAVDELQGGPVPTCPQVAEDQHSRGCGYFCGIRARYDVFQSDRNLSSFWLHLEILTYFSADTIRSRHFSGLQVFQFPPHLLRCEGEIWREDGGGQRANRVLRGEPNEFMANHQTY